MSKARKGDQPSTQAAVDLERLKWSVEQLPDQSIPIHPPANLGPKVITIPREGAAAGLPRYIMASDGEALSVIDTRYGQICACSVEGRREWVEELLRLANRPE